MNDSDEKYLSARVRVPASASLEVVATWLSEMMPGFRFDQESTGRYEEVPAFVAEKESFGFALLGIPEGEQGDEYELTFDCTTELSIDALVACDEGGFIGHFVREKPLENGIFMDFSVELAHLLAYRGIAGCKPILLLD